MQPVKLDLIWGKCRRFPVVAAPLSLLRHGRRDLAALTLGIAVGAP
jgi:hypothetical protein